jgi:hypothetical protein
LSPQSPQEQRILGVGEAPVVELDKLLGERAGHRGADPGAS